MNNLWVRGLTIYEELEMETLKMIYFGGIIGEL